MYEDILKPIYFCVAVYSFFTQETFCFVKGFVELGAENKETKTLSKTNPAEGCFGRNLWGLEIDAPWAHSYV